MFDNWFSKKFVRILCEEIIFNDTFDWPISIDSSEEPPSISRIDREVQFGFATVLRAS